jgi:hypothetical protein
MIPTMTIDWSTALRPAMVVALLLPVLACLGIVLAALVHARSRGEPARRRHAARARFVPRLHPAPVRVAGRGNARR